MGSTKVFKGSKQLADHPVSVVHAHHYSAVLSAPYPPVVYRCNTIEEAEAFIAGVESKSPHEVHAGEYSIDAPEDMMEAYTSKKK